MPPLGDLLILSVNMVRKSGFCVIISKRLGHIFAHKSQVAFAMSIETAASFILCGPPAGLWTKMSVTE